jgi:hypothetical protein
MLVLKIDVTARSNELCCDVLMPIRGRAVEWRFPRLLCLKIDVTARSNEQFRDGHVPFCGRAVERRDPRRPLEVDEGMRAWCRQQRADLCCVAMLRGIPKPLPRHIFPTPYLLVSRLFTCNLNRQGVRPTHKLANKKRPDMSGYQYQSSRLLHSLSPSFDSFVEAIP